jgi:hypothetical protein
VQCQSRGPNRLRSANWSRPRHGQGLHKRSGGPPQERPAGRSAAQYLGEEEAIRGFRMNSPSSIPVTATIPESKNG